MRKQVKLYNVLFPIWFLILYPTCWIVVLPVNFAVDLLVLWLCCRRWDQPVKEIWKRDIWLCWGFGFLGDIVGCTALLATSFFPGDWWSENIISPVNWNPFVNVWAVLTVLAAMALASLVIYLLDRYVVFRKRGKELAHKMALTFAIATTPVTLLIPSALLYMGQY